MANIRLDLKSAVVNGQEAVFKSPADCSAVTGLKVYYPTGGDTTAYKTFQFADAHGNNVGGKNLFAANVLVKVILDTQLNRAYVQNADTNKYIEDTFVHKSGDNMTGPLKINGNEVIHAGNKQNLVSFRTTVTVPVNWSRSNSGLYTQRVSVAGIKQSDTPFFGLVKTFDISADYEAQEAWNAVSVVEALNGELEFTCYDEAPRVDIPLQITCIR